MTPRMERTSREVVNFDLNGVFLLLLTLFVLLRVPYRAYVRLPAVIVVRSHHGDVYGQGS